MFQTGLTVAALLSILSSCTDNATDRASSADDEKLDRRGALRAHENANCIRQARVCSFEEVEAGWTLDWTAARSVFDDCLREASVDGRSCEKACNGEEAADLCNTIVVFIERYSERSFECLATFQACADKCVALEPEFVDDGPRYLTDWALYWKTGEARCMVNPGSGRSCDEYARMQQECGGQGENQYARCMNLCEATIGAFAKDTSDARDTCDPMCR